MNYSSSRKGGRALSASAWAAIVVIVIIIIGVAAWAATRHRAPATATTTTTSPTATTAPPSPSPTVTTTAPATTTGTTAQMARVTPHTPKDTLVIAMDISDAVSMDPARAYEFTSVLVVNQIYDKLVDIELPNLTKIVPEVAESWKVMPDGKTWIFHIRKGIKFANGDPLTADAVVFSLRRVLQLKQTASWILSQFISSPDQIQKVDDYTVKIVLDKPYAPTLFLQALAFTTSAIVDPKVVLAHQKNGDLGSAWLTDHSAGSGPYILEKWVRDQEIVLVANEHYWRGPPKIKKIIIKHVPEPGDQMLLIKKGDVDMAVNLLIDQIVALKGIPGLNITKTPELTIMYIGMNTKYKPLSNEKVREAIRYCIDYDAIINDILKGGAIKWQTIIPKGLLGALAETPFTRDVNKAKSLLAEAGYPNGFSVELITPPMSPYTDIATLIQANLLDCNIKVKIVQMTAAEMYEKYRKQGHQMILAEWGSDYADPDDNAKAFGDYRIKQLAWRNAWYDDYAADLVEKAMMEFDSVKRAELYKELSEYILHHGPYAILLQEYRFVVIGDWVKNFIPDPTFYLEDFSKIYKEYS